MAESRPRGARRQLPEQPRSHSRSPAVPVPPPTNDRSVSRSPVASTSSARARTPPPPRNNTSRSPVSTEGGAHARNPPFATPARRRSTEGDAPRSATVSPEDFRGFVQPDTNYPRRVSFGGASFVAPTSSTPQGSLAALSGFDSRQMVTLEAMQGVYS
nr:serine/arginine repetitive matrix protein 1-like [Aedes albopictus]